MLPRNQIGEGQRWTPQLLIQPDTEVMQSHLGSQANLKPGQRVGTLPIEAKHMLQATVNRFNDLADAGQPAPPRARPRPTTVALGGAEHLRAVGFMPESMPVFTFKAFVGDIRPLSRSTDAGEAPVGASAQGEEGLGQRLIFGAGCSETKAGDHTGRIDRQQHMKALIPTQAITPADIGQTGQPAPPPAFTMTGDGGGAIQRLIGTVLSLQSLQKVQKTTDHGLVVLAQQPIELSSMRQAGKSPAQVSLGLPVEIPFTGKG